MPPTPTTRTACLLAALASGTALLGLVGFGLARAATEAQEREHVVARRDARDLAVALRAALRHEAIVAVAPAARRFTTRDGDVAVEAEVGWLRPQPTASLDATLAERLREAHVAEFTRGDAAAAAGILASPPGDGSGADACLPLLVATMWQAQRAGDAERARGTAARLDDVLATQAPAALASPRVGQAVAARALFAAARHDALPAFLPPLLQALPAEPGRSTLARLREHGVAVADLAAAHDAAVARRELLLTAAAALREAPARPVAIPRGEHLLVWFPAAHAPGQGSGALLDAACLAAVPGSGTSRPALVPGLPAVPDRGRLVVAPATPPPGAEEVVPEWLWVEPLPPQPLAWTARPAVVLAAAGLLVLVFAASAAAVLRAFRQEAAALRARSEFLTGVTHELKTPVASMRLVAEVLRDDDVPAARQREYVALLAGEATRLSALVDNVLDLGQLERGERAIDLRAVDLADVVRDVAAAFAPLAERAGLAVAVQHGVPTAPARADANALAQALLNVLENARKYAAAGRRIDLATSRRDGTLRITVRDFGPGVPAAERDAVFARFQRGAAHRHGSIPGVGLGLFLARSIVQRHGGTLHAEAPPEGPGACFVFTLPLTEDTA